MNSILSLIFSLFAFGGLISLDDKIESAYFSIILIGCLLVWFIKRTIVSTEKMFSPISIFIYIYNIYAMLGIYMWIYREKYSINWDGNLFEVLYYFVGTSIVLTNIGNFILSKEKRKAFKIDFSELHLNKWMFVMLLCLEYIGIYLYTAGFTMIPILQSDIDVARFELAATSRAGAGIGAVFIYVGLLCIVHLLYTYKNWFVKGILLVISFLPFVLYGGRLMMLVPLIFLLLLYAIKKRYKVTLMSVVKTFVVFIAGFFILMLYGIYRQKGEGFDEELFTNFFISDFFPEFRGAVAAFHLNKLDLTLPYISYCISMLFPGFLTPYLGINKAAQISVGGYISNLFGYSGFGIRTSITGELLLTNPFSYVIFWIVIFGGVCLLNKKYFQYDHWGKNKVVYLFLGLYYSLIIPYGISLFPNIIMMIVLMLIIKRFAYGHR